MKKHLPLISIFCFVLLALGLLIIYGCGTNPTGGGGPWTLTEIASGTGMGNPSLAIDSANKPKIAYVGSGKLMYADWTGSKWNISTVEASVSVGSLSLALNNYGSPEICYYDDTHKDLRYARFSGTTWETQLIDDSPYTGIGSAFYSPSLAFDGSGYPKVCYFDWVNGYLKYAKWNNATSTWEPEIVENSGNVTGAPSLIINSLGRPQISYCDNLDLKHAKWTGATWTKEIVDNGGGGPALFNHSSITMGSNEAPMITYIDTYYLDLRLARWNVSQWFPEIVDDGSVDDDYPPSLKHDSDYNPRIAYIYDNYDNGPDYELKCAVWSGSSWHFEVADNNRYRIMNPSLAIDTNGKTRIAYVRYSDVSETIGHIMFAARN